MSQSERPAQSGEHPLTSHAADVSEAATKMLNDLLERLARGEELPQAEVQPPSWRIDQARLPVVLEQVTITHYRALNDLVLDGLGRVNLIAGVNNAGKTSVLEAVYHLARLSDARLGVEIARNRARRLGRLDGSRVAGLVPDVVDVAARLAHKGGAVRVHAVKSDEPDAPDADRSTFQARLTVEAKLGRLTSQSTVSFHTSRFRAQVDRGKARWLCPVVYSSPFTLAQADEQERHYEATVSAVGLLPRILDFLRNHIDPGIMDISRIGSGHYVVAHRRFPRGLDLASFGDGVQRIFLVLLQVAAAQGGWLLIDELENAVHADLLEPFALMLGGLAHELGVQLFVTTHSKEAVAAWVGASERARDVVGYNLHRAEGRIAARRIPGEVLHRSPGLIDLRSP